MTRKLLRNSRREGMLAARGGYSLVEMLIVMTILLMLVVIALPAVKRVMEDGNVREASRQLNAYFAMAKARALQTGRPCGVMMVCDPVLGVTEPNPTGNVIPPWPTKQITQMYLAEVPPPYSGGTIGAKGRIMASVQAPTTAFSFYPLMFNGTNYVPDTISEMPILNSLIQPGEIVLVRFEFKGPWFVCQYVLPSPTATVPELVYQSTTSTPVIPVGMTSTGASTPLPPGLSLPNIPGYTFQIMRMPRRIGNPLELSAGTCIDVAYSGVGPTNMPSNSLGIPGIPGGGMYDTVNMSAAGLFPGSSSTPKWLRTITVMFTPGGGIDSVFLNNLSFSPATTVHFLIGRADRLNDPFGTSNTNATRLNMFDPDASNLANPQSLWVSVSRANGNVVTSDNLPPPATSPSQTSLVLFNGTSQQQTIDPSNRAGQITYLALCRQLATSREQVRGQ